MMLRRLPVALRCLSTASASSPTGAAAAALFDSLMHADWVDADDSLEALAARADALVAAHRPLRDAAAPDRLTYDTLSRLHVAKEAARIAEAYAEYAEHLQRAHEDMVGALGDRTQMPEDGAEETLKTLQDYVDIVNAIADREVRLKFEQELGRKMVVLRQVLSVHNFSASLAPIAGDRIVTNTKKH